ncbi:MAG TPA: hypothetical protein VGD17_13405 [Chitinophagaceae bacterium]
MKWTLLLAFSVAIAAGCEKTNHHSDNIVKLQSDADPVEQNSLTGKWRLVEYFQDKGDGTGQWVPATEAEEITFTASGEVIVSSNSPLASRGYNRYRIIDKTHVELYSTSNENRDIFYYNRESNTSLIFNPQCRENCSRRYQLVS